MREPATGTVHAGTVHPGSGGGRTSGGRPPGGQAGGDRGLPGAAGRGPGRVGRRAGRVARPAAAVAVVAALIQATLLGQDIIALRWPRGAHRWSPDSFLSPLPLALAALPALLAVVAAVLLGAADGVWSQRRAAGALVLVLLAGLVEFRVAGLLPPDWPARGGFPLDERVWAVQAALAVVVAGLTGVAGVLLARRPRD